MDENYLPHTLKDAIYLQNLIRKVSKSLGWNVNTTCVSHLGDSKLMQRLELGRVTPYKMLQCVQVLEDLQYERGE